MRIYKELEKKGLKPMGLLMAIQILRKQKMLGGWVGLKTHMLTDAYGGVGGWV